LFIDIKFCWFDNLLMNGLIDELPEFLLGWLMNWFICWVDWWVGWTNSYRLILLIDRGMNQWTFWTIRLKDELISDQLIDQVQNIISVFDD
jgi:hypothetical protein